jgi:ABC-type polysaccharide/polyol phosphate transport system ATPase subunit
LLCGSEPAILVDDLWLTFRTTKEKPTMQRRIGDLRHKKKTRQYVDALKGVTFDVPRGGVYAVIGKNGAGKSTLLRAMGGVYLPSKGKVTVYERPTLLLSLGVGFNAELTGRENILLGGLAHGLLPDEIREHEDEIIEFADIGDAIDYPVRTYSSGMGGRLAFAVAAFLEPGIVLIDEALGAGDAKFKSKAKDRIDALCEGDRTVVLVSHGLRLVKKMADQALWLEEGEVKAEGPAEEVVAAYLDHEHVSEEDEGAMDDI